MPSGPANANSPNRPDDAAPRQGDPASAPDFPNTEPKTAPEDASVEDWVEAENGRPTLPEETADGLDDTDEEIRRQAEDMPLDTPGRLR